MKKYLIILVVAALILTLASSATAQKMDRGKNFIEVEKIPSVRGTVDRVNASANTIEIKLMKSDKKKILKVTELTKLYKKTGPGQLKPYQLKAKVSDFKKGDIVIATADSVDDRMIKANKIWDIKAFLVYTDQITTEVNWAGRITKIDPANRVISIVRMSNNEPARIKVIENAKIFYNGWPGKISDFKVGEQIAAVCRWPGFKEDRPDVVIGLKIQDTKSYVIHTFRDKFGPVLARGIVSAVDMKQKIIKVDEKVGTAQKVRFGGRTKWIPGTPNIKKPSDFVGYNVYIFGEAGREKTRTARQVINEEAIPALFQDIITSGGKVGGEISLLAMGELISLDSSRISVRVAGGEKVVCRIHKTTAFVHKGKRVSASDIDSGDWVMVRGIVTPGEQQDIALVVVSFGRAGQKFKEMTR